MKRVLFILMGLTIISCTTTTGQHMKEKMGTANLATINCVKQGGRPIVIVNRDKGDEGYCKLENGTEIEEWEYFKQTNPGVEIIDKVVQ